MTPERASEIIAQAKANVTFISPWSDQLDKVMTKDERNEVRKVWHLMPGTASFVDALVKISNTR